MNFQTSSLWNLEPLVRVQADLSLAEKSATHKGRVVTREVLENATIFTLRQREGSAYSWFWI